MISVSFWRCLPWFYSKFLTSASLSVSLTVFRSKGKEQSKRHTFMSWLPTLWHLCTWSIYWTHSISDTAHVHSGKMTVISKAASQWLYDMHVLKYLCNSAMLRGQSVLFDAPGFCALSVGIIQVFTCIHFPENNVISVTAARKTVRTQSKTRGARDASLLLILPLPVSVTDTFTSAPTRDQCGSQFESLSGVLDFRDRTFAQIIRQYIYNKWPESLGFRDRLLPGERPYLHTAFNLTTSSLLLNYWAHRDHSCSRLWGWWRMIIKHGKQDESLLAFHMVILGEHLRVHVCVVCTPAYMCTPSYGVGETCLP